MPLLLKLNCQFTQKSTTPGPLLAKQKTHAGKITHGSLMLRNFLYVQIWLSVKIFAQIGQGYF